jgi:hypothetical protein
MMVLDERYLFAAASFLVYLATSLPVAALLGLPVLSQLETQQRETWTQWMFRLTGLSASPRGVRGWEEARTSGQIWITGVAVGSKSFSASDKARYRSPIFCRWPDLSRTGTRSRRAFSRAEAIVQGSRRPPSGSSSAASSR